MIMRSRTHPTNLPITMGGDIIQNINNDGVIDDFDRYNRIPTYLNNIQGRAVNRVQRA